jgi:hypothetical protein
MSLIIQKIELGLNEKKEEVDLLRHHVTKLKINL